MTATTEKKISKAQQARDDKAEAIAKLREIFPPGSTVSTTLNHVSSSGMSRRISVIAVLDGQPANVDWLVSRATGYRQSDKGGIIMSGCGMDMGFALAYNLSRVLYRDGFDCVGERTDSFRGCPSNDHSNGDRNYKPHKHSDGGYALRHAWL